jgi:hypothetical protein
MVAHFWNISSSNGQPFIIDMLDGRSNSNFHLVRLQNIDSAAQFSMFGVVEADVFVAGGEDMKDIYKKIDIGIWRLITLNSSLMMN